jgi:glycerol transport system permease protein
MSLKTNAEILGGLTLFPRNLTFANYMTILTDPSWYMGYVNSIIYVSEHGYQPAGGAAGGLRLQPLPVPGRQASVLLAADQPHGAARGVRAALLPALFSVGLFDTHIAVALAHTLFNVPLAVWILEGFMRGVPKEIDETAYIDGYSFPRFFVKIFMPLIASGIGVAAFFCFMFSWVELLLSRTLTATQAKPIAATMTRTIGASGSIGACLPPPVC